MRKLTTLVLALSLLIGAPLASMASDSLTCWFPPGWKKKASKAKEITAALTDKSAQPR